MFSSSKNILEIWELVQELKFHTISENNTDCEDYNLFEKMIEQIRYSSSGNVSQTNNDTSDVTYKEAYNMIAYLTYCPDEDDQMRFEDIFSYYRNLFKSENKNTNAKVIQTIVTKIKEKSVGENTENIAEYELLKRLTELLDLRFGHFALMMTGGGSGIDEEMERKAKKCLSRGKCENIDQTINQYGKLQFHKDFKLWLTSLNYM